MAVLEEDLAKVKESTKVANEKTAELSKNGEEFMRQARVLKNATVAEDEKQTMLSAELERIKDATNTILVFIGLVNNYQL